MSRLRAESGLTQARLADQLGVAVQTISRIEAGKVRVSLARAKALAGALGVPLSAIVAVTEGHTGVDEDPGEQRLQALWRSLTPASRELAVALLEQIRDRQEG